MKYSSDSNDRSKTRFQNRSKPHRKRHAPAEDFRCGHCNNIVTISTRVSGVQNRNHCPYCLWSRHVDLNEAGDRLAACKAQMQPIGLTLKKSRNKYSPGDQGELMLIHRCVGCGKLSINRIAADDDSEALLSVFESSFELDAGTYKQLESAGISALQPTDRKTVQTQLFGKEMDAGGRLE